MTETPGAPPRQAVVIEDDPDIAELLAAVLTAAGFHVRTAGDGDSGLELVRRCQPVLVTLDVNLPGFDGLEVARRIRSFSSCYVLMLSAKDEEMDVVMGLAAGADEYVTKPFRPRELRARVEAMLRRRETWLAEGRQTCPEVPAPGSSSTSPTGLEVVLPGPAPTAAEDEGETWLEHHELRLNPGMRVCEVDGEPVDLTRSEFDLLLHVMERGRLVASKELLALELRGDPPGSYVGDSDRRSIEGHVANLRRKLGDTASQPRFVETVRGVGYRMTARP